MVEITDEKSAEAWFKTQPQEICVAMACRAALRVFGAIGYAKTETLGQLALPTFRAMLTSAIVAVCPTAEVEGAARSAARSADFSAARSADFSAARSAAFSARSAARSADFSAVRSAASAFTAFSAAFSADTAARSAAFSALSADTFRMSGSTKDRVSDLLSAQLWQGLDEPTGLLEGREKLFKFFDTAPTTWRFWKDWYLQMYHEGEPDWDLCREVALIPDDIWTQGPEAVAREIERIEARRSEVKKSEIDPLVLADALPLAETIAFDDNAKAFAVPIHMERENLLSRTLSRVSDAVEDVLFAPNSGLHERSYEIRVLRRTIDRYSNDPARTEMDFVGAHATLTKQMVADYIPASSENLALQSSLEEGARAIRATHPEVAENRALLTGQSLREMSEGEKTQIAEAAPIIEAISRDDLAEDFKTDTPVLIADRSAPTGGAPTGLVARPEDRHAPLPEEVRYFSRVAKIWIKLKESPELLAKVAASSAITAASLTVLLSDLVELGLKLLALIP